MVKAVDHDGVTGATNTAAGGVLGAVVGTAAVIGVGAALFAGAVSIVGLGAFAGGAAIAGGIVGAFMGAGPAAAIGGLLGMGAGAHKVAVERKAFLSKQQSDLEQKQNLQAQSFNNGEIKGLEQGHQAGFNDGQVFLAQQLQAAQQQQAATTNFAGKVTPRAASNADMIKMQQQEQAALANQRG